MTTSPALPWIEQPPSKMAHAAIALDDLPPDDALASPPPSAAMLASVRAYGVLQSIIVALREPLESNAAARYDVVAGRRRGKAARAVGLSTIDAVVFDTLSAANSAVMLLSENHIRDHNPIAEYEALERLRPLVEGRKDLGRVANLPQSTLAKLLAYDALLPALRDDLLAGKLRPSAARQLAKLPPHLQERAIEQMAAGDKVTGQSIRELRSARIDDATQDAIGSLLVSLPGDLDPEAICSNCCACCNARTEHRVGTKWDRKHKPQA